MTIIIIALNEICLQNMPQGLLKIVKMSDKFAICAELRHGIQYLKIKNSDRNFCLFTKHNNIIQKIKWFLLKRYSWVSSRDLT